MLEHPLGNLLRISDRLRFIEVEDPRSDRLSISIRSAKACKAILDEMEKLIAEVRKCLPADDTK
jgi:hypothetical protein